MMRKLIFGNNQLEPHGLFLMLNNTVLLPTDMAEIIFPLITVYRQNMIQNNDLAVYQINYLQFTHKH